MNLAFEKPVIQRRISVLTDPGTVVDGDPSTCSSFSNWWNVDLGRSMHVVGVVISGPTEGIVILLINLSIDDHNPTIHLLIERSTDRPINYQPTNQNYAEHKMKLHMHCPCNSKTIP